MRGWGGKEERKRRQQKRIQVILGNKYSGALNKTLETKEKKIAAFH